MCAQKTPFPPPPNTPFQLQAIPITCRQTQQTLGYKPLSPSVPPPPTTCSPNSCFLFASSTFYKFFTRCVIQKVKIGKLFGSNKFEAGYDPDHRGNCSHEQCQFLSEFSFCLHSSFVCVISFNSAPNEMK